MNLFTKRLGLLMSGVVGVGVIATLATGASFALFSSTADGSANTFTAGTVVLATDATATAPCDQVNLAPGDSSVNFKTNDGSPNPGSRTLASCTAGVDYTGSLGAFIGVYYTFSSSSGLGVAGGLPLLNSFGLSSTNAQTQFEIDYTGPSASPGWPELDDAQINSISCNSAATASLVQTCTGNSQTYIMDLTTDSSPTVDLTDAIDYYLPSTAGNLYQGSTLTVTLHFMAVQADNNNAVWNSSYSGTNNCALTSPSDLNLPTHNASGECPLSWS
jgi:predicted ribosomally synthesized peptide with SipW-like signal peptide